jgi:hypothetical protein
MLLERVKGIEPSYSAWKAAALPLSYTRARPINYHGRQLASTSMRPPEPLTGADSVPILMLPSTQRKEVIQCLSPSAVTSLGSPAKLSRLGNGALSAPGPASYKSWGATGAIPSRLFYLASHQRHPGRLLNFRILLDQIKILGYRCTVPSPQRGVSRSSRTRGGMRWTRGSALTKRCFSWTAKSCGPDAPTLVSSWRSYPPTTMARKPGSPGRARNKLLKPLRGECRVFPV